MGKTHNFLRAFFAFSFLLSFATHLSLCYSLPGDDEISYTSFGGFSIVTLDRCLLLLIRMLGVVSLATPSRKERGSG